MQAGAVCLASCRSKLGSNVAAVDSLLPSSGHPIYVLCMALHVGLMCTAGMGPASLASNRLAPAQPLATPLPTHPLPALLAVLGRFLHSIDQLHCSTPNLASFAVLGRFLHSLNQFCHDEYDMRYSVSDYWVYDFAKVR